MSWIITVCQAWEEKGQVRRPQGQLQKSWWEIDAYKPFTSNSVYYLLEVLPLLLMSSADKRNGTQRNQEKVPSVLLSLPLEASCC